MTTSLLSDRSLTVYFLNFFAGFTLVPFLKTQSSLGFWATNLLVIAHLSDFGLSLSSYVLLFNLYESVSSIFCLDWFIQPIVIACLLCQALC